MNKQRQTKEREEIVKRLPSGVVLTAREEIGGFWTVEVHYPEPIERHTLIRSREETQILLEKLGERCAAWNGIDTW